MSAYTRLALFGIAPELELDELLEELDELDELLEDDELFDEEDDVDDDELLELLDEELLDDGVPPHPTSTAVKKAALTRSINFEVFIVDSTLLYLTCKSCLPTHFFMPFNSVYIGIFIFIYLLALGHYQNRSTLLCIKANSRGDIS